MENIGSNLHYCSICLGAEKPEQTRVQKKHTLGYFFKQRTVSKTENTPEFSKLEPCGHRFHYGCIFTWLIKERSCPVCRERVVSSNFSLPRLTNINQLLIDAVNDNNLQKIRDYMDSFTDITACEKSLTKPLRLALKRGHDEIADLIISRSSTPDTAACADLALLYFHHPNAVDKQDRAFQLAAMAANNNCLEGQTMLGIFYLYGFGVTEDRQTGINLLTQAAGQGDLYAARNLTKFFFSEGSGTQAVKWLTKCSEKGDCSDTLFLGDVYYLGRGGEKNHTLAKKFYKKAAKMNAGRDSLTAMLRLGQIYTSGETGKKNLPKAYRYFKNAFKFAPEDPEVLYLFGRLNIDELKNSEKGLLLVEKASSFGSRKARQYLEEYYHNNESNRPR